MKRHVLLIVTLAALAFAGPLLASERADLIVRNLQRDGYTQIEIGRTWLGRTRIVASGPDGTREIVVHPSTGEVLRDVITTRDHGNDGESGGSGDDGDDGDDGDGGDDGDDGGDDGGDGDSGGDGGSDGDGGDD